MKVNFLLSPAFYYICRLFDRTGAGYIPLCIFAGARNRFQFIEYILNRF